MLVGMVEAAIKWMKAGLPLRQLKIVLYANVVKGKIITMYTRDPEGAMKAFAHLKERHNKEKLIPVAVPLEYDIYLSHSVEDGKIASMVEAQFLASKPDIRIYKSTDEDVEEEADGIFWQEDLFKIMSRCARVVPILSPAFLESKACVDLYNMALCCNRRAQRDVLAPLYIEHVKNMPTYMGLVQYIDCSPKDEAKIHEGCKHLIESLEHASMKVHTEMVIADASPLHYDVFVSYSHKDSKLAVPIVEKLQMLNPRLKIFFDIQELKAGTAWQRMLYHAIDGCRSFMCLVSNSYMQSAMCIEEFNLALAKHCSSDSMLCLIPVCIETLVDPRPEFLQVKLIDATPAVFDLAIEVICLSLVEWIGGRACHTQLDSVFRRRMGLVVDAAECAAQYRRLKFILKYGSGKIILKRKDVKYPPSMKELYCPKKNNSIVNNEQCDIAFSCAPEDRKFVSFMSRIIHEVSPGLVIKETANTETDRQLMMESARKVVVFLSANYLESVEQVEEFHTVLLRQKYRSTTQVLFPIILHSLPHLPTYFHLVPCDFNFFDPLWMELHSSYNLALPSDLEDLRRISKGTVDTEVEAYAAIGVIAAIHSLLEQLKSESEHPQPLQSNQQPVLLNVMLLYAEINKLLQGKEEQGCKSADDEVKKGSSSHHNPLFMRLLDIVEPPQDAVNVTITLGSHQASTSCLCRTHEESLDKVQLGQRSTELPTQNLEGNTSRPSLNSHSHSSVVLRDPLLNTKEEDCALVDNSQFAHHQKEMLLPVESNQHLQAEKHVPHTTKSRSCVLF